MNLLQRHVWAALAFSMLCWPAFQSRASAQEDEPDRAALAFARGTHCFRSIIDVVRSERELKVLTDLNKLAEAPKRSVLIVYGKLPQVSLERLESALDSVGGLRGFVMGGGALLVVSDEPMRPDLSDFGIWVNGTLLRNDWDFYNYDHNPAMPVVLPEPDERTADVPVFHHLLPPLVTSRPSYLDYAHPPGKDDALKPLAFLPPGTRSDRDPNVVPEKPLFAVGGRLREGRVLFLADHSMFINCVIMQEDNSNFELARNCLEWIVDSDGDKRDQLLYLQDGIVTTDLNVPLEPGLELDEHALDQLIGGLNLLIAEQEKEDSLNSLLQRVPRSTWITIFIIAGSVLLLLFMIVRLGGLRFRAEPGSALFPLAAIRYGPSRAPLRDRTAEVHREGNFRDATRGMVQQFFSGVLGDLAHVGRRHAGPPQVRPRGLPGQEVHLNASLREFWTLAYGPIPRSISSSHFQHVLSRLRDLRRRLAGWQLHMPA